MPEYWSSSGSALWQKAGHAASVSRGWPAKWQVASPFLHFSDGSTYFATEINSSCFWTRKKNLRYRSLELALASKVVVIVYFVCVCVCVCVREREREVLNHTSDYFCWLNKKFDTRKLHHSSQATSRLQCFQLATHGTVQHSWKMGGITSREPHKRFGHSFVHPHCFSS